MPEAMWITHVKGHEITPAKDEKKPGQAGLREGVEDRARRPSGTRGAL